MYDEVNVATKADVKVHSYFYFQPGKLLLYHSLRFLYFRKPSFFSLKPA